MRAEQQQPPPPPPPSPPQQQWRVNLLARSRRFSVEVRATAPIPTTWSPPDHHRLSILLRLWSFVLRVQSDCEAGPPRRRRRFLRSRFVRALQRIRGLRAQKRVVAAVRTHEPAKADRLSVILVLISSLILGAISAHRLDKIGAAVVAVASTILIHASKKSLTRQASLALVLLSLLSIVRSSCRASDLARYAEFAGDRGRRILWKIWKSAVA